MRSVAIDRLCAVLIFAAACATSAALPGTALAGRLADLAADSSSSIPTGTAAHQAKGAANRPKAATAEVKVVEYYLRSLDHYFITADPAEQQAIDSGAAGPWERTGDTFLPVGTTAVCRFYGNTNINPATGGIYGPNSHFYTADPNECGNLKAQFTPNAKSWKFESNDFLSTPAVNGACLPSQAPVYRAYNNGFARGIDSNHRLTTNKAAYDQTVARGWIGEGVVMCAQKPQFAGCGGSGCPAALVRGNGPGLVNVIVEVTISETSVPIVINFPAGRTYQSRNPGGQDGLLLEFVEAGILDEFINRPPKSALAGTITAQITLRLFCLNMDRSPSGADSRYQEGPVTTNPQLLDLISIVDGKLSPTLDVAGVKALAAQQAVWEITDGSGALPEIGRALLVQLMAETNLQKQTTLYQQFIATLTIEG